MDTMHTEQLLESAGTGDLKFLKALLHGNPMTDINSGDRCQTSALHYAADNGHLDVVEFLISNGALVNVTNMWEKTPLHAAANSGHLEIVKLLVENGARIEAQSSTKRFTPLHLASQFDHLEIVEYLIANGADVCVQAEDGRTAYDLTNNEDIKIALRSASQALNARDRLGRERRNSEAFDAYMEQQARLLDIAAAVEERLKREKAEDDAEKERKAREEEEQLAIREQKKREDDEKQAEIDRLLRIEEEKKFEAEMIRRQEEEALRDHERRLFGACNAAAKTVFFTANVSPSDAERDQLGREREFAESELKRIAREEEYAELEKQHAQRIMDEIAANEEKMIREKAAAEAEERRLLRIKEAEEAEKEANERLREAAEAEEKRVEREREIALAEKETIERELEELQCKIRELAAIELAEEKEREKERMNSSFTVPSDWVPTRWQVEAAEQKAREEEEANRIIAAEAKKKLIEVIINPDNYYGHDLPNVPYALLVDWTDGFDESNCIGRFEPGVWGEMGGCGKRFEGVVGDLIESRSFRSLSVLAPCSTDNVERMDLKKEEAQRRFRHVSIKRLQGKIADITCPGDDPRSFHSNKKKNINKSESTSESVGSSIKVAQGHSGIQSGINFLHSYRHPNIIRLLGYSAIEESGESERLVPLSLREGDARDCLIYEIAAKGGVDKNLSDDRLARNMTWQHRVRIAAGIACALNYLHCRTSNVPVYHKNIQSAKVVLTASWCPKLVDVGLIKDFSEDHPLSRNGIRFGTPAYMCPQYNRTGKYEEKSEIFSFGLVLAELFSGILQTVAADSGEPLEERVGDIEYDVRAGNWPLECRESFRALAIDCLLPYSRRVGDIATVMNRLRALETTYCPRSGEIVLGKEEEEELSAYREQMSSRCSSEDGDEGTVIVQCDICALFSPRSNGVLCPGRGSHFLCDECFDGVNLRHQLAVENSVSFASHDCRLVCELCVPAGELSTISDEIAAKHLSMTGFVQYMRARHTS